MIGYGNSVFLTRKFGGGTPTPPFSNQYSMLFDGVDEYFKGATTFSELDGGTQFTLSMWVKVTDLAANRIIFHIPKNTTANNSQVLVFLRTSGSLDISVSGAPQFSRSIPSVITAGNWHHVLICFDLAQVATANKIRPFVDGVDVFSSANALGTSFPVSSGAVWLGEEANGYIAPFLGNIDEVALWNSDQRSNVAAIYNSGIPFDLSTLGTAPDHWYRMGDGDTWGGSSWTLSDNIGSYDLGSINMEEADRLPISPNSYSLNSFSFDGIDESFNVGSTPLNLRFNRLDTFSFSAWVKVDTSKGNQILCNQLAPSTNYRGYYFAVQSNNQVRVILRSTLSDSLIYTSTTILSNGLWYHIVFTYDGTATTTGGNIYINNTLDTLTRTGTLTGTMSSTDSLYIGSRNSADNFFDGNLDEVAIFNTELSASDVSTIFNNGVPTDISSLSPLSHWRMGENATWNGSTWTLTDQGSGGNNATSVNMEEADKTGDQPYVI